MIKYALIKDESPFVFEELEKIRRLIIARQLCMVITKNNADNTSTILDLKIGAHSVYW